MAPKFDANRRPVTMQYFLYLLLLETDRKFMRKTWKRSQSDELTNVL